MGKKVGTSGEKNWQTETQSGEQGLDPQTQAWIKSVYDAAQRAGGAPPPSGVTDASGYYGGATAAGREGIAALGGDAAAAQRFMNPYQGQVIDAMMKQFGVTNAATQNQISDAATRAGAFGGSRHGVASGVAMGEAARNQNAQIAGLLSSGFEGAMGRAGSLRGLGYGAAGAGANLGMTAGNPDLWRMEIMRRGFQGLPYGTTSRGTGGRTGAKLGYTGEAAVKIPFLG